VVEIEDQPFQRFAEELARTYGLQLDLQHMVLRGLCSACAAKAEA
jgi:Fe2+ or Zn2+ uptake regulation protein